MNTTEFNIYDQLCRQESERLSPSAAFSRNGIRRREESLEGYRQSFAKDADRILHSRAYTRYIDKTQVFCLISNDHITHRVLHVQLVSRIARTAGRFLHLNEDLIEAIALGHDIGHPPFGHAGEQFLSELCREQGLPDFQHNIQSVRALDRLERKGRGWNLTLQTLDGILCHDGEVHSSNLSPVPETAFDGLRKKIEKKSQNPKTDLKPITLEGCVVRMADTIAYIGRDIEDAIILGMIDRKDLPAECVQVLGDTNGTIVYNLVTDMIRHSKVTPPGEPPESEHNYIGFSNEVSDALKRLKQFNYRHIYLAPQTKQFLPMVRECYRKLFNHYLVHLKANITDRLTVDLMSDLGEDYITTEPLSARVRDFIAGMTDDYFLEQAKNIGCTIPSKR